MAASVLGVRLAHGCCYQDPRAEYLHERAPVQLEAVARRFVQLVALEFLAFFSWEAVRSHAVDPEG